MEAEPTRSGKGGKRVLPKDAGAKGDRTKRSRACVVRAIIFDPPQGPVMPADKPKDNTGNGAAAPSGTSQSSGTTEASRQAANAALAQAPPAAERSADLEAKDAARWKAAAAANRAKMMALCPAPNVVGRSGPAVQTVTISEEPSDSEPVESLPSFTAEQMASCIAQARAGVKGDGIKIPPLNALNIQTVSVSVPRLPDAVYKGAK